MQPLVATHKPKRILLVEDDADDREFFNEAIHAIENIKVAGAACNGKDALEWLRSHEADLPDYIFTDMNMPVMNGLDLITMLKSNPATKHIAVIVLSSDETKAAQVLKLGAKAAIDKYPGCKTLIMHIERVICPWKFHLNLPAAYAQPLQSVQLN